MTEREDMEEEVQRDENITRKMAQSVGLDGLLESFYKYDTNRDGMISRPELRDMLHAVKAQQSITAHYIDSVMDKMDEDKDRLVTFEEFVKYATQHKLKGLNRIKANFDTFPRNAQGRIPLKRFSESLKDSLKRVEITQHAFDKLARLVNGSKDATVSFTEFVLVSIDPSVHSANIRATTPKVPVLDAALAAPQPETPRLSGTSRAWRQAAERTSFPKVYLYSKGQTWHLSGKPPAAADQASARGPRIVSSAERTLAFVTTPNMESPSPLPFPFYVLFVECEANATEVYHYRVAGREKVELIKSYFVHASFAEYFARIRLPHVPSDCNKELDKFVARIFHRNEIDKDSVCGANHVVFGVSGMVRREVGQLAHKEVLQAVTTELRGVMTGAFDMKDLVTLRTIVMGSRHEATCEHVAAQRLFPKLSSVFGIDQVKMQGTSSRGYSTHCAIGTLSAQERDASPFHLWKSKMHQHVAGFDFGLSPLFVAEFVTATTFLIQWLRSTARPKNRNEAIADFLGKALDSPGVRHEDLAKCMRHPAIHRFLSADHDSVPGGAATHSAVYYLQQVVVCGQFDPEARVVIRDRFLQDGSSLKVSFSLGWMVLRDFRNERPGMEVFAS